MPSHATTAKRRHPAPRRHRVETRRPWWTSPWLLAGTVAAVAAVVAILLFVGTSTPRTSPGTKGSNLAPSSVVDAATNPDVAALAVVGVAGESASFVDISKASAALTRDSHPLVVFVSADYCPFCAARRWGLVVALSRFGTFSNLGLTSSSSTDTDPNTSSFSFHGSSYSSSWISFDGVETETSDGKPLDAPDAQVLGVLAKYDVPPYTSQADAIPFLDLGGRYLSIGAGFSPALLQGMSAEQIAKVIRDPHSPVGQAIMADANAITAAVCTMTGDQPASVCAAAPIPQVIATLEGR